MAPTQTVPTPIGLIANPGPRPAARECRPGALARFGDRFARGARKLGRIILQRRIPGPVVRWLRRNPDQSLLWRFAHQFYSKPSSFFRVFGCFPLPVQPVSYQTFPHREFQPVRAFSRTDRPGSVQDLATWTRWTTELPAELQDAVIPSCHTVFLPGGLADARGTVFSADGELVVGASLPVRTNVNDYYAPTRLRPPVYRGGSVAVLTNWLQDNYYHWLMDVLPRLHMLRGQGLAPDRLYVQKATRFQIETLALLGVRDDQCLTPAQYDLVSADNLVVPFHEMKAGMEKPAWVFQFLRSSFLPLLDNPGRSPGPKRLYISREQARMRRVTNEPELLRLLEPLGFQKVTFERQPFLEQVALFAGAEAIIAPHGAALANLAFAQPGTKVIDLQPSKVQDTAFRTSRAVGLDYYYLTSSTGPAQPVANHQDITVDLGDLQETIRLTGLD